MDKRKVSLFSYTVSSPSLSDSPRRINVLAFNPEDAMRYLVRRLKEVQFEETGSLGQVDIMTDGVANMIYENAKAAKEKDEKPTPKKDTKKAEKEKPPKLEMEKK